MKGLPPPANGDLALPASEAVVQLKTETRNDVKGEKFLSAERDTQGEEAPEVDP